MQMHSEHSPDGVGAHVIDGVSTAWGLDLLIIRTTADEDATCRAVTMILQTTTGIQKAGPHVQACKAITSICVAAMCATD